MATLIYLSTLIFIISSNSFCNVEARNKKAKSVTTLLDAKWEVTPLVLEIAEYLADENVNYFWSYIDTITSLKTAPVEIENDRERYRAVVSAAANLLTPAEVDVMKLGLSLHIYSPKVEMFGQMAVERNLPKCPIVADVGGKLTCDAKELNKFIKQIDKRVESFRVDHHYPGSENKSLAVVLYGELGTTEFAQFHRILKQYAIDGNIDYIVRHYVRERPNRRLRLSGYGVELQMKSTEYKVQDDTQIKDDAASEDVSEEVDEEIEGFDFNKLKSLYPDMKPDIERFKQHLVESSNEMAPLKVWQFQELSLQAAERIMASPKEEVLKVFTHIAQNFPMQAKSLVRTVVKNEMKEEMKFNQEIFTSTLNIQPADTALFINGLFFDLDVVDVISLLEVLRQELRAMEGLHNIGISNNRINSLLALDFNEATNGNQEFAMDIRDSAVNWINDIENDSKYSRWGTSLMELLRPTFPGMLRHIKRNLFNLVLIVDPLEKETRNLLKLAGSLVAHSAPIRVGLVFSVESASTVFGTENSGVAILCAFNYVSQMKDPVSALNFIIEVHDSVKDREVEVEDVRSLLKKKFALFNADDILGEDSDYDFGRSLSKDFIQRSGLRTLPQALMNGIPLPSSQVNTDEFEDAILQEVMSQTPVFQKAVYRGKFVDSDDAVDYIMSQPNVMPRLNERILSSDSSFYLDMSGKPADTMDAGVLNKLSPREMTATAIENFKYFSVSRKGKKYDLMTYWVIGDLNCLKSRKLLLAALQHMKSSGDVRVFFIPNVNGENNKNQLLNKVILAALQTLPSDKALQYVLSLLEDDSAGKATESGKQFDIPAELKANLPAQEMSLKMLRVYSQRVLSMGPSARGVIANGRVLGPLDDEEEFDQEDFALLERFSMTTYGEKIEKAFNQNDDDDDTPDITSNTLLKIVSMLVSRPQTRSRFDITFHSDEHSVLKIPASHPQKAAFDITAIVDPVSRGAQKLGPILLMMQDVLNCNIRVFLNSVEKNSDMPLKSFYRFVLEPEIQFTEDGKQTAGPIAKFSNMPTTPLLTQNMLVPENWLVEVVRAVYDLDNIRLEDVESVVHSEYELEYLLLEGHCFESTMGNPPRGLQITLGTEQQPVMVDTIVMANLGYFQLKANPGAWLLRLRQGRSADLFDIVSHEGSDTPTNSTDVKIIISSLRSHVLKLKVQKKPDKLTEDLLSEGDSNSGIWNSITSSFGGGDEEPDEKLNIFSLASGHLYERFLRIMMMSVIKNTKTPVKFWFLKNYLSPQFKDLLPYMAKEYGFEYELVQYKWPRWLHQQTEKQRIIWGYKILFLDVLFPLDVKKIIFVDADQVVRADLKELQQLDLGGAPYGYTPFCDSRTEMDGFRFWKQGYWRNHLQGRRYHISALYVVDLKRFRRIAAGDRLRGQYQALSQDPNSLSNLDQDLPNNMIHQVAIKSLPQEWLWCETWCDDTSKSKAKTIDLCNNPLTKEAKLTAAVRILPEWRGYDNEIRELQKKIDSGVLDPESSENEETIDSSDVHSEL